MLDAVMLIGGLMLLVKSADFFVRGSSSLARRLGISSLVIGLTIVAFGTSAPELVVSTLASIRGANDVAVGNILGSNIANVALIIGIAATIRALKVQSSSITHEIPFGFLALAVLYILVQDRLLNGYEEDVLTRNDGLILLSFLIIFMYYVASLIRRRREEEKVIKEFRKEYGEKTEGQSTLAGWKTALLLLLGILGLVVGGRLTVEGAVNAARLLGISDALIAITVVAIGTSLPELATSAVAAWKHESDIAIGNVLGSNVFNIFFVLGVASTISPIPFNETLHPDLIFMMALTALLFAYALRRRKISRTEGISFLVIYALYLGFLIWRG